MAFANPNYTDLITTTLALRSKEIADNVTNSNAILSAIKKAGNFQLVDGGRELVEPLSFGSNANATFYSGYDTFGIGASDNVSAAKFDYKFAAVPVSVTGSETLLNVGKSAVIDLVSAKIDVAIGTLQNIVVQGIYSDGSLYSGKGITGLQVAVPLANTTGTYGGIDRATYSFWRNQKFKATTDGSAATTNANIQGYMNKLYVDCSRGVDTPDLIVMDNAYWQYFMASLQPLQRFTSAGTGSLGFETLKFMGADVVHDNATTGIPTKTMYMLNSKYLKFKTHKERNFAPIAPETRASINQDAHVQMIGWAGNMTCSGAQFLGVMQE